MLKRLNAENAIGIICLAVSVTVFLVSLTFPKASTGASDLTGPAFYPKVLAIGLFLCGLLQIVAGFRKGLDGVFDMARAREVLRSPGVIHVSLISVLIVGYIFSMELLGFTISTFTMLFLLMWRFGVPWTRNLFYSAAFVAVIYLMFGKLFTIYLPSGLLDYIEF